MSFRGRDVLSLFLSYTPILVIYLSCLTQPDLDKVAERAKHVPVVFQRAHGRRHRRRRWLGQSVRRNKITSSSTDCDNSYSLLFAERGANVVVNDMNKAAAQAVVDEITNGELSESIGSRAWTERFHLAAGGKAAVNASNVVDGEAVIRTALEAFGGVHILINNAGILRCVSIGLTDRVALIRPSLAGTKGCSELLQYVLFRTEIALQLQEHVGPGMGLDPARAPERRVRMHEGCLAPLQAAEVRAHHKHRQCSWTLRSVVCR